MTAPVISFYESNDSDELDDANPLDLGSVDAGIEGTPVEVHLWNNKAGVADVADITNVRVTTVTKNGYYAGDTVPYGKEVVENKNVGIKSLTLSESAFTMVGGSTMKNIGTLRGGVLPAPGKPTATPGEGAGSVANGTYYYKVSALDFTGETLCGIESDAVVVTGSDDTIAITWTAVANAASYKVYRKTEGGSYGASSLVATVLTNSATDILLTPGTGTPKVTATVTQQHYHAWEEVFSPDTDSTSGAVEFKTRVLYQYTD